MPTHDLFRLRCSLVEMQQLGLAAAPHSAKTTIAGALDSGGNEFRGVSLGCLKDLKSCAVEVHGRTQVHSTYLFVERAHGWQVESLHWPKRLR